MCLLEPVRPQVQTPRGQARGAAQRPPGRQDANPSFLRPSGPCRARSSFRPSRHHGARRTSTDGVALYGHPLSLGDRAATDRKEHCCHEERRWWRWWWLEGSGVGSPGRRGLCPRAALRAGGGGDTRPDEAARGRGSARGPACPPRLALQPAQLPAGPGSPEAGRARRPLGWPGRPRIRQGTAVGPWGPAGHHLGGGGGAMDSRPHGSTRPLGAVTSHPRTSQLQPDSFSHTKGSSRLARAASSGAPTKERSLKKAGGDLGRRQDAGPAETLARALRARREPARLSAHAQLRCPSPGPPPRLLRTRECSSPLGAPAGARPLIWPGSACARRCDAALGSRKS